LTKILVCNPSYYQISYEINPWMSIDNQSNKNLAKDQWFHLVDKLKEAGANVVEMSGESNLPDMVFTANAGLVLPNKKVILAKFKHRERQPERIFYKNWFQNNGYEILEDPYPENSSWEGAGDALYQDNILYLGYGFRSDYEAISNENWKNLGFEKVFYMNLKDPYYYHLDTCFCPLPNKYALINTNAFDEHVVKSLSQVINLLPVAKNEAEKFACNAVSIENTVIIPSGCSNTKEMLMNVGFQVFETDMSEFMKSGGACKCLTLKI